MEWHATAADKAACCRISQAGPGGECKETMSLPNPSIMDTRRHQMVPVLEPMEIERVRRFGKVRSYGTGEALAKVGEKGHGLTVILAGTVRSGERRVGKEGR